MNGPSHQPFESYAQNFEDVVLWRALGDIAHGTYVDVGAFGPVVHSVTWAFYLQGWSGVAIEPVPSHAEALRAARPRDVTIEAAAGRDHGAARLFSAPATGISTLVEALGEAAREKHGVELVEIEVRVAPLDDLLADSGLDNRPIHFCKIDAEGSESDVLAGFDLDRWRPWVLVVEATEPNRPVPTHEAWEPGVLDAGYRFCLFDGLNRFYVHAAQEDRLAASLSYPACVFDEPFMRVLRSRQRVAALEEEKAELWRAVRRAGALEQKSATLSAEHAIAELRAIKSSVSWRLTRPLRAARRAQLSFGRSPSVETGSPEGARGLAGTRLARHVTLGRGKRGQAVAPSSSELQEAFVRRLNTASSVLAAASAVEFEPGVDGALANLQRALTRSAAPDRAKVWLSLVAVNGAFPGERSVERVARLQRMGGPSAVARELNARFQQALADGSATTAQLDVVRQGAVIDVSHTVDSDLNTGIQRVVRETVSQWISMGRPITLAAIAASGSLRRLSPEEVERVSRWRDHLARPRTGGNGGAARRVPGVLVPWGCVLVVPELFADPTRLGAYRGLTSAGVLASFSLIGYDLIPITAAETVHQDISAVFPEYLAAVKRADRVSVISRSSAHDFAAFASMAPSQGLSGPVVEAHLLPIEATDVPADVVDASRSILGIRELPLVLVVGSHEPRKNHVAVLEAAERLWAREKPFQLLLMGWSGWKAEEFDELVDELVSAGRPLDVRKGGTEEELWSAYRLARFTVFPSLLEGFGLPVAESLAAGTPVITSRYGSMAEIADGGGCLLVDPRDVDALEAAMERLLEDDELLERLRKEAAARPRRTWREYAEDVWRFLVEDLQPPMK